MNSVLDKALRLEKLVDLLAKKNVSDKQDLSIKLDTMNRKIADISTQNSILSSENSRLRSGLDESINKIKMAINLNEGKKNNG